MAERDVSFLLYRCQGCRRLITKLQLISRWSAWEKAGVDSKGVCKCGSGRLSPTNASTWEELTSPAIWKLWWVEVVLPKLRKKAA